MYAQVTAASVVMGTTILFYTTFIYIQCHIHYYSKLQFLKMRQIINYAQTGGMVAPDPSIKKVWPTVVSAQCNMTSLLTSVP